MTVSLAIARADTNLHDALADFEQAVRAAQSVPECLRLHRLLELVAEKLDHVEHVTMQRADALLRDAPAVTTGA